MSASKGTTVYLHLGTYKTATSFLQSVLWQNFDDPAGDIYYPRIGTYGQAHHYLATDEFPRWTKGVIRSEYEQAWHRLLADITGSAAGAVVISSEMLCSLFPEQIRYIRERLRDYPVRAVIYLRRPDQYISSLAAQLIKGCNYQPEYYTSLNRAVGFFSSAKQFDGENMCAQWAQVIGAENLVVRPFEPAQFREGDILTDFFHHLLGRPVPGNVIRPSGNLNPRLCRDALEFKQLVNRLPVDRETMNATLPGLLAYSAAVDARTQSAWQEHVILSPSRRLEIIQRYADSNARIARLYMGREDGVLFKEPRPEADAEWTPYPGLSPDTLEAMIDFLGEANREVVESLARAAPRADQDDRELRQLSRALIKFAGKSQAAVPDSSRNSRLARWWGGLFIRKKNRPADMAEAANPEKELVPALFLHIRKTGGTSIVRQAIDHYGYENVCGHGDYMGKAPGHFKDRPFVSGHFGFDYARELLPGRFSFTFLRNPVERIISLYSFCRIQDPEEFPIYRAASEHDLDGFLKAADSDDLVRSYICDSQVWCLASGPGYVECAVRTPPGEMFDRALINAEQLSLVGFTETFDDDARLIMRALKINPDEIRKDNVTKDKIDVALLPAGTRQLLEELTQWDQKLYDAIWQKRRDRLKPGG